jgi:hypothetical protein
VIDNRYIQDFHRAPNVWGLLCIDCWDVPNNRSFYEHAVNQLANFNIGAVVNCCTNLQLDYQDKSVYNTLNQYLWTNKDQKVLSNLINCAGHAKTDQHLHDKIFTESTVHLSSVDTFRNHVQKNWPTVQDWIILGSAWGMCVTYGPLGIDKLVGNVPELKFNVFPDWSIQDENAEYITEKTLQDDFHVWSQYPAVPGCYRWIRRVKNELQTR